MVKLKACASEHRSCDDRRDHALPVRGAILILITMRERKECTMFFCHQTKACAASTAPIFVAFVNKILHETYIYTIISIKNVLIVRRRIKMASMAPDPSSLIRRTPWSHDLCLLLAQALVKLTVTHVSLTSFNKRIEYITLCVSVLIR